MLRKDAALWNLALEEREGVKGLSWRAGKYIDQGNFVELATRQHGSLVASLAVWFLITTFSDAEAGERWRRAGFN